MKVACIQSSAGENYNKNFKQIVKLIHQSIKNKADLIITPETTSLITSDKKILYKYYQALHMIYHVQNYIFFLN